MPDTELEGVGGECCGSSGAKQEASLDLLENETKDSGYFCVTLSFILEIRCRKN